MKVRVRIAVAVDPRGDWNAAGWDCSYPAEVYDRKAMEVACEGVLDGSARYWLEADLDVPEVPTINAEVTEEK